MKKVLLVNPLISSQHLSDCLKTNSIYSIALYTIDFIKVDEYFKPKPDLFDEQLYFPDSNFEEIIENLSDTEIDYVINGGDGVYCTKLTDLLSQYFTPQYANSPESTEVRADKIIMHEQLKKHNLSHINQFTISKKNYFNFIEQLKYPVFIKPRNGEGSIGAMSVDSSKDLIDYFENKEFTLNTGYDILEYIVAEKLDGEEYLIDTFSVNGEHYISTIQKYEKQVINGFPRYISFKVETNQIKIEKISKYVIDVLNATEFKNGFAHIECFYTKSDEVVLVEINPRISGARGSCHKVAHYSGQQSQIDIMVSLIFGNLKNIIFYDKFAIAIFLYNGGRNIMLDLNKLPLDKYGVVSVVQFIPEGQFSSEFISKVNDAAALMILIADTEKELEERTSLIQKMDDKSWEVML